MVERGLLGGFEPGRAEEVGGLGRHVGGDRQLQDRRPGHEVDDGLADRAAANAVLAGRGSDEPAVQAGGVDGVRHGGPDGRERMLAERGTDSFRRVGAWEWGGPGLVCGGRPVSRRWSQSFLVLGLG
ncbi:hypothetical protein ACIRP2_27095 [Streptomyces sp. NPDC101194]|uniref:hypothetical protein n=1 Tax=Streptomyces sp. NPDC101194 TaxID=3366127 RepID=UPI00382E9ADA